MFLLPFFLLYCEMPWHVSIPSFTSLPFEVRFQTPVLCLSQSFQFTCVVMCTCAGHSSWDPVLKFSDSRNWVSLFPRTLIFILSVLCTVLFPVPWITSCRSRCSVSGMYREELRLICPPTPSRNVAKGPAYPFSGLFCKGLLVSHVLRLCVCALCALSTCRLVLPVGAVQQPFVVMDANGSPEVASFTRWACSDPFPPKGNFNSSSF